MRGDLRRKKTQHFSIFVPVKLVDKPELTQSGGRVLRAAEDVLPKCLRRQVSHEILQKPQRWTTGLSIILA